MILHFGLQLDDYIHPKFPDNQGGIYYCGERKLLQLLELFFGESGYIEHTDYLRIEQYRQILLNYLAKNKLAKNKSVFFEKSFSVDPFATTTTLLSWRDELVLADWNFDVSNKNDEIPERLKVIAAIEQHWQNGDYTLSLGYADRFKKIFNVITPDNQPFEKIFINEPLHLLPFYLQRLFKIVNNALVVSSSPSLTMQDNEEDNDLAFLKKSLATTDKIEKKIPHADGSLIIIRAKRDLDAAAFVAKLMRKNVTFKPAFLIPELSRTLDDAMIHESLPSFGIPSASLARPVLQILKLAAVFLWRPLDIVKIMEFVSLYIKPLDDGLSRRLAEVIATSPGVFSDKWVAVVASYFENLEIQHEGNEFNPTSDIRGQYKFWFERRGYDINKNAPKNEIIEIFESIAIWASKAYESGGNKNYSLLSLNVQAKRICELLDTVPETQLTYLELERIVRTIYEPSPVEFSATEIDFYPFVQHPSAIIAPIDALVWWNFTDRDPVHFFSKWYNDEILYLQQLNICLDDPKTKNKVMLWQREQALKNTKKRIVLVIPEMVNGKEIGVHPLFGNIEATFKHIDKITYCIDSEKGKAFLSNYFAIPKNTVLEKQTLGKPQAFITLQQSDKILKREHETLTSLEKLLYYPHQWVFEHQIKLKKTNILSISDDNRLKGNLAHRLFELMLKEDIKNWKRPNVELWINQNINSLLKKEGATLLMYGKEPDKEAFINKVKLSAWNFISMLNDNGWSVEATEKSLEGEFNGISIKGKIDLILRRGEELAIVDFKWGGMAFRKEMIKNRADLQLVMYSKLVSNNDKWAHTAYFIIENNRMLARNNDAFKEAEALLDAGEDFRVINQSIYQQMEATYNFRQEQLQNGILEVRTEHTCDELEEVYGNTMAMLEMKRTNSKFDDYKVLINLVE